MFTFRTKTAAVFTLCAAFAPIAMAQQPAAPSTRFAPERMVPPSVHVPDASAVKLKSADHKLQGGGTSFNFSDMPPSAFRPPHPASVSNGHPPASPASNGQSSTRLVSFDEESNAKQRLPEIPAVLRGSSRLHQPAPQTPQSINPADSGASTPLNNTRPQMDHSIVVDSKGFETQQQELEATLNELKQLQHAVQHQRSGGPQSPPADPSTHQVGLVQESETINRAAAIGTTSDPVAAKPAAVQSTQWEMTDRVSADNQVRPVASEELITGASIHLSAPAIRVQAVGPDSIGMNKVSSFKINVTNEGSENANDLTVGLGLPEFVDVQNINLTTGHHETTDGIDQPRVIWTIDRIEAGRTHSMTINAIPQSAESFDLQLEWSMAMHTGAAPIRVTQPQLEMRIAGPTEVMFGEKATFHVTIANTGTGTAEQVSIMLPEALGGERANIGDVPAGEEKKLQVELFARTAGKLNLAATAVAEGNVEATTSQDILVRRANLNVAIVGPSMKYAGTSGQYTITVANDGDASAPDVFGVLALPNGVKYLGGVDNLINSEGGLKWNIGTLTAGDRRSFQLNCQLDSSGDLLFQVGARGGGDLAATADCRTRVETIADLTLRVEDPKGPLPTGENVNYRLIVKNRGSRTANGVNVVMQFSEGIEPFKAEGFKHKVVTGQVIFSPIPRIEPGQEIALNVSAQALKAGNHIFRAQLTCDETDTREIAEGTTRFFGDDKLISIETVPAPEDTNTADAGNDNLRDRK